jgi:hypothetical protein
LQLTPVRLRQFANAFLVSGERQRERMLGHVRILALTAARSAIPSTGVAGRADSSLTFATSRRLPK